MTRKLESMDLIAVGLVVASAVGTAAVFARLPDPMPTHFDLHGAANGFMPRAVGAVIVPIVALGTWALVRFGGQLLPREWRERQDASPMAAVGLLVAGLLVSVQALIVHAALSPAHRIGVGVWALVGGMFVLLGQVFPRVRRNPFVGIRTAWTLTSDENWARTHRVAGYTMTVGGTFAVVAALVGSAGLACAFIVTSAFAPALYSWRLARRV